ncbi:hypothetical protein Nstercoris_00852 [Nitrosomonas stercoris]|uniref:CRISPR system Cms protein Csm5 n=1 Tax=Nitrosomonas stercoris TaxID=1444684 RepID=A0A4Y1YP37_9PROT|nr:hypothetical protein Nstercoris_00852 [Nitrosomonas stercoris]
MTITHIHPLRISTLSPIHIGCDEVFEPTNFVIDGGLLHVLDPADVAAELDEKEKQQLMQLADSREPIGSIQHFFKERRSRLAQIASQWVDVAPDIAREYEEKSGKPQQRSSDGRTVYNLFPMARTAFNSLDGVPYLPGSSLKGAIRTAWLNYQNKGKSLLEKRESSTQLQQRLLGYQVGKFENDPFRSVALADAHVPDDRMAPPTRIVYAVSKKKKPSERGSSPELKVFLETVRETMADAFSGELRLTGKISWQSLCDACNTFYRPQLESELDHEQFRTLFDPQWRILIKQLLAGELGELMKAQQGFLLRVGKHSGAESLTLEGIRSIKIKTPNGKPDQYRSTTTEKRFASTTRAAISHLLPFGWIWVHACDDAHQYLVAAVQNQVNKYAAPILETHGERIVAADERIANRANAREEAARRQAEAAAAEQAKAAAQAAREAALAAMTENQRRIEAFSSMCARRAEQLRGSKENPNAAIHNEARALAKAALEGADWTIDEKHSVADAIEEWLPKLVKVELKNERKKLKLSALRT